MDSVSFDRIADRYDDTRGGIDRGRRFAAVIDPFLEPGDDLLEIGVGTGVIAQPLQTLGHHVIGIDLSREMLSRSRDRVESVVEGDATRLPFASERFDAVVAVWAVHLIGDFDALIDEVDRVMRPGSPLLVVSSTPDVEPNDLSDIAFRFGKALGRGRDRSRYLVDRLTPHGFTHETDVATDEHDFEESPMDRAAMIERRDWSSLWDLDDSAWRRVVQPVIDDLRALPEPDRPRRCLHRHILSVYRGPS
ncbi:MAG: methyltransferase domain-containing protein [Acidobacteria bacterium]|nr:methyltransferase domain-containing protein [Acidobacteriota bacterium]